MGETRAARLERSRKPGAHRARALDSTTHATISTNRLKESTDEN